MPQQRKEVKKTVNETLIASAAESATRGFNFGYHKGYEDGLMDGIRKVNSLLPDRPYAGKNKSADYLEAYKAGYLDFRYELVQLIAKEINVNVDKSARNQAPEKNKTS